MAQEKIRQYQEKNNPNFRGQFSSAEESHKNTSDVILSGTNY